MRCRFLLKYMCVCSISAKPLLNISGSFPSLREEEDDLNSASVLDIADRLAGIVIN